MELSNGSHLAYCTNIHRGETWDETFRGLREHALRVRSRVCPADRPWAVGLRLGREAADQLADPATLESFRRWLADHRAYVFTINGFPYGRFHGTRVKEQVYAPDWTTRERVDYTNRLFDLLSELVPEGGEGSVSTLPGSFKEFVTDDAAQGEAIVRNLADTCAHVESLRARKGQDLHLGLEPEPLGWFETTGETLAFFRRFREATGSRFDRILGVNYDACHLAVEFESARSAVGRLRDAGVRLSKIHLSSALRLVPAAPALERLRDFEDEVYLHQVVVRTGDVIIRRFRDLGPAVEWAEGTPPEARGDEWRIHFHIPLHEAPATEGFGDTRDHLLELLDVLAEDPRLCRHLEMETYTWEVLPERLRSGDVVDQLEREYRWTLDRLGERGVTALS